MLSLGGINAAIANSRLAQARELRVVLLTLVAFVAVNLGIAAMTTPNAAVLYGADAATWVRPAEALVSHGRFVDPDDPTRHDRHRPPLYPAFLAATMILAGSAWPALAVALQTVLLFATGLIAWRFTELVLPRWGPGALALVALNPNALGAAHLIQSETLSAFLVAAMVWGSISYLREPRPRYALGAGAALGFLVLTRPETQFLIPVLPLAVIIRARLIEPRASWRTGLLASVLSLVVAASIVAPWMARNAAVGEGFRVSTWQTTSYYLWGGFAQVEMNARGISEAEAEKVAAARRAAFVERYGPAWEGLSEPEQDRLLFLEAARAMLDQPPAAIAKTVLLAVAQFNLAAGAGNFHNLFGATAANPFAVYAAEGSTGYLSAWLESLHRGTAGTLLITTGALLFVCVMRVFGLIGLIVLVARREWAVAAIVLGVIAYYALIFPFYGNSRFRLNVECLYILLALAGMQASTARFRRHRKAATHGSSR